MFCQQRILSLIHRDRPILELKFGQLQVLESLALVEEYASMLSRLRGDSKALVLIDFQDAHYDPSIPLAWKAHLGLFSQRVEKSAVVGASRLATAVLHGYANAASLLDKPLPPNRCVIFEDRILALDFLAAP